MLTCTNKTSNVKKYSDKKMRIDYVNACKYTKNVLIYMNIYIHTFTGIHIYTYAYIYTNMYKCVRKHVYDHAYNHNSFR